MSKIVNIAESLARLYDEEVVRLDIQYNMIKHKMVGYLALGDNSADIVRHEFEIQSDCSFTELTD